jgi:hypothetical protein
VSGAAVERGEWFVEKEDKLLQRDVGIENLGAPAGYGRTIIADGAAAESLEFGVGWGMLLDQEIAQPLGFGLREGRLHWTFRNGSL